MILFCLPYLGLIFILQQLKATHSVILYLVYFNETERNYSLFELDCRMFLVVAMLAQSSPILIDTYRFKEVVADF